MSNISCGFFPFPYVQLFPTVTIEGVKKRVQLSLLHYPWVFLMDQTLSPGTVKGQDNGVCRRRMPLFHACDSCGLNWIPHAWEFRRTRKSCMCDCHPGHRVGTRYQPVDFIMCKETGHSMCAHNLFSWLQFTPIKCSASNYFQENGISSAAFGTFTSLGHNLESVKTNCIVPVGFTKGTTLLRKNWVKEHRVWPGIFMSGCYYHSLSRKQLFGDKSANS